MVRQFIDWIKKAKFFGVIWWYYLYPMKWGAFLRGTYQAEQVPFEFCEIVIFRSVMCGDCLKNGACIDCGCNMPDKMMDLKNGCSLEKWDTTTIEQWNEYKKRTGLKFLVQYGE